jgi:hypothetical protein
MLIDMVIIGEALPIVKRKPGKPVAGVRSFPEVRGVVCLADDPGTFARKGLDAFFRGG